MDGTLRETLVQDNIQWPTGEQGRCQVGHDGGGSLDRRDLKSARVGEARPEGSGLCRGGGGAALLDTSLAGRPVPHRGVCVPAGLAVDYHNERLYWADAKLSVIGSIRLNGTDPVVAIDNKKGKWRPSPAEQRGGEGPARGRCPWGAQQMAARADFPC